MPIGDVNSNERVSRVWELTDPNEMFEAYLYHSHLYYDLCTSEISDYDYDRLCSSLVAVYDRIEHPMKEHVTVEDLSAGTGYHLSHKYPQYILDKAKECSPHANR